MIASAEGRIFNFADFREIESLTESCVRCNEGEIKLSVTMDHKLLGRYNIKRILKDLSRRTSDGWNSAPGLACSSAVSML